MNQNLTFSNTFIIFSMFCFWLCSFTALAQSPQKVSYQSVIRNASNQIVANQQVGVKISIIQGSESGEVQFSERHTPTTNSNGLISVIIGNGTLLSGNFTTIDWANGPFFLKSETDPAGGTNYTITMTNQILSVPYAIHAKTAETVSNETDPVFSASPAHNITGTNMTNWNTAFEWGNHASAGYLTSFTETDPLWSASPSFGISNSNISNWNTAYGWGNHAGLYRSASWVPTWDNITGKPTFATVASSGNYNDLLNLPTLSISNWNTAYSWGNHAGLYRPVTWVPSWDDVTGKPTFATVATSGSYNDLLNLPLLNISNWDAAYSWGNHATQGYLTSYTETDPKWSGNPSQIGDIGRTGYVGIGTSVPNYQLHVMTFNNSSYMKLGYSPSYTDNRMFFGDGEYVWVGERTVDDRLSLRGGTIEILPDGSPGLNGQILTSNGTTASWQNPSSKTYQIGESAFGGIVFWVDATGQHGLVCAKTDQSTGVRWYAGTNGMTQAKGDGPFAGKTNTGIIIASQVAIGDDGYTYAARICNELQVTDAGITYGDWYLPSRIELNLLYLAQNQVGGLTQTYYWSSTESNANNAWRQNFGNGVMSTYGKYLDSIFVRAIRAF